MAQLRCVKFGKKSEKLDAEHKAPFDEAIDADLAALEVQVAELMAAKRKDSEPAPEQPKRAALPAHLTHGPNDTTRHDVCLRPWHDAGRRHDDPIIGSPATKSSTVAATPCRAPTI